MCVCVCVYINQGGVLGFLLEAFDLDLDIHFLMVVIRKYLNLDGQNVTFNKLADEIHPKPQIGKMNFVH